LGGRREEGVGERRNGGREWEEGEEGRRKGWEGDVPLVDCGLLLLHGRGRILPLHIKRAWSGLVDVTL
jgi:hypothetical protein